MSERDARDSAADAVTPTPAHTPPAADPGQGRHKPDARGKSTNKGKRVAAIAVVVALVCVLLAGGYWWATRNEVSTDDAYIKADIVQIAPRVTGTAAKVFVRDNQHVDKGEPLFTLDPADFQAALASAEANLQAAKAAYDSSQRQLAVTRQTSGADTNNARAAVDTARAEAQQAEADAKRYRALYKKREVSRQQLDRANTKATSARARLKQARAQLSQAQTGPDQIALKQSQAATANARVAQAKAEVDQARLNLSYTEVRAPQSGKVAKKSVLVGSHLSAGQAALAIVADDPWVVANFKETQLTRMRVGQPVAIDVDAFPDHDFTGKVQSIQPGTGVTFSLLPPQNATGNFVKIVQRVPVKIVFDKPDEVDDLGLAPGMSVVPRVNVAAEPEPIDQAHPATATATPPSQ